ncbi:MAG: DUF1501 domain-containing protein [Colwellia sp.]|nr:DUF1501 domain-containing protein [Colwellia sp.]MCW8866352.1 DUF1501 domain-containing protein [Colwellia sp.]MCW9080290.1 DUF1501 domain-containing protein [Colwellia sp.]
MSDLDKINTDNQKCSAGVSRRKFLQMTGAGLAALSFPARSVFAQAPLAKPNHPPKIVWILLRGALDSLHTIVPRFDEQYKKLRPKLSASFKSPLLPIAKGYALHPALKNMHQLYQEKSLLPIVAVSSGYQQRSHFDGQDFLESGKAEIDHDSGWLARAIDVKNKSALAVSRSTPISLRSSEHVNTWYPSNLKNANEEFYAALGHLYQYDEALKENLASGLKVKGLAAHENDSKKKRKGKFIDLTKVCAKLMLEEQGLDCAMLELGGWDTHNNQSNRLEQKLTELDVGLAALKDGLGESWDNTVVVIGTEFGRTAKENGTAGTDHGTGSALILAGGAVDGGKVLGDWPGLNPEQLFEQRDLMPTSNSFSWIANVLVQHWDFSADEIRQVFPDTAPYNQKLV